MMRKRSILWMAILAMAGLGHVLAAPPTTLQRVRGDVDASGRVRNINLERQSGWQTMHAFACSIELADDAVPGGFQATGFTRKFRHGQRFRLRIETATDLYIYVLVHNADGSYKVLLPNDPSRVPLVAAGQSAYLPAERAFRFDPPPGKEQLRLLASPKVLPWVEPCQLWELENLDKLTPEQEGALAQLRSVRGKSIDSAVKHQGELKRMPSIDAAIKAMEKGTLTRGAEVVAAETEGPVQQIIYASASPNNERVLVHDIVLDHVE